jgi:hypothetical protein
MGINAPAYDDNPEVADKIAEIQQALVSYGQENSLRGLEGRIQRGLDPAGLLAVPETRERVEKIASQLGADMNQVIKLTNELHVGAIWDNADTLGKAEDPNILIWMILADITNKEREKEGDMTEEEFIADLEKINGLLDQAIKDPEMVQASAKHNNVDRSKDLFSLDDDVPMSTYDAGFLAMAINGYKGGIVKDKNNLLFVGSKELDYKVLEQEGLKPIQKEDRGRETTFYQDADGNDVVKKLYTGLAIVFDENMEIAKKLARTAL